MGDVSNDPDSDGTNDDVGDELNLEQLLLQIMNVVGSAMKHDVYEKILNVRHIGKGNDSEERNHRVVV